MQIIATNFDEYLAQIPEERKSAFVKLREVIVANLPLGFEEAMSYGMIGYVVPKKLYPAGYHCSPELPLPFVSIASQKNFIAFYHMGIYAKKELHDWFVAEYPKYCSTKLDMGKSCVRFKKIDNIPYELIAQTMQKMSMQEWVKIYEREYKR